MDLRPDQALHRDQRRLPVLSLLQRLERFRQPITFILVGGTATVTHIAVALAVEALIHIEPLYANFIAYCTAVGISYFGNAWLTFRQPALHGAQFLRFAVVSLLGLLLNQSIVYVLVHLVGWPFWAALIPAVTLVPIFTFSVSKLWAFRPMQAKT